MSPEFEKILRQAGVDPNIYKKEIPGRIPRYSTDQSLRGVGGRIANRNKSVVVKPIQPATLRVGPLQETHDPVSRMSSIKGQDVDTNLKMIFQWVKDKSIDYAEFEDLLAEVFHTVVKKIK